MDAESSPVVEEKMMTPVKAKPVPSVVESSMTPVKEKRVDVVKELSVMSVMKKGVMSVVKEEVMEMERVEKEEVKMEEEEKRKVKEEEEQMEKKEEEKKEEGEKMEKKEEKQIGLKVEEKEKKEEPSTRLSEEATLARLADLMRAEQARIDRMRDDNHRLRGDVASNRSTPTGTPIGTPTGTAEKVLPVRANTQTAAHPVSQTPSHPVSQTPSHPVSQTPTQATHQTPIHVVSQTPTQTTHQTPSQTKPPTPDQTALHTPSQPKLPASHTLQVMAETPVKGAADTRSSHEEMLQVKTQELLQRVEDMKKRNEASKRKKEEKSILTPSRPNLPPSASSWEKLSTAKKVKMEDLTLPVYVKPKENPSERSFISFVSSPMTARLAGKQKRAETGAPASIKSSAKPVSQGLPTVSRNPMAPMASVASVGPVGPVGPRRVLMTPAQENHQSALPSQVGKEKGAAERVSVKREKAEGVVARSAEKKPELENRVPTVTKLPSNVQSSHSEVKREVVQPTLPALPVQSAQPSQPSQPAQPTQPHHRLNAVEENGKPWYEEPNINRLLYRQHQLVSRFVGQSAGCDE